LDYEVRAVEIQPRKLVIFDIDDTLVHTQTTVQVVKDGRAVKALNSHDFTHYKLQPGESFDFENFRNAQEFFNNSKPIIPMMNQLKQDIATGNKVVMVTARADFDDRELFLDTFRKYGVDMDRVHVYRAGNMTGKIQTEEKKKIIIRNLLDKGNYTKAIMYDDAVPNLTSFVELKDEYPRTKFYAWHVSLEGEANEYHRTNESYTLEERRKKKRKPRWAAYGPGLYGGYGYFSNYGNSDSGSDSGGGDGGESIKNENFVAETAMMGKIADSGKIIRILKKAHTVPFSDEKNWLLVDMDPAKGNKGLGIKWIPADTRFEWVRSYRDSVDENFNSLSEGLASRLVNKMFFARSNKTPKGWSYDHVGFITQDGKQIQMSGHKGNDVYITNAVTDDPEFLKQNIKIVSLPKPVSVPTTNTVGAENCGTFVANVLQANGVKGIDTQQIYSVFKKPPEQTLPENFADGRNPQDKGDAKRHGVNTKGSISSLRNTAKQGGRKGQLAHWMANMKAGKAKNK